MAANQSNLSSPKYGCDFVVATTQQSINSTLREYLSVAVQPVKYLCFLVNKANSVISDSITLEELIAETGVNPFEITDSLSGEEYDNNQDIYALNYDDNGNLREERFGAGIKMKAGLPPGLIPRDLPDIVTLGETIQGATFNSFFSELQIIENKKHLDDGGDWNVYEQATGEVWYLTTEVNLEEEDLPQSLDTTYFNNNPAKQSALRQQLQNINGPFDIKQLYMDLTNYKQWSITGVGGEEQGIIYEVMDKYFVNYYMNHLEEQEGKAPFCVHTVINDPNGSSLRLTDVEHKIGQILDDNGEIVVDPTPQQQKAKTLANICAVDNHTLPHMAEFDWNWVEPNKVDSPHGYISIKRATAAKSFADILVDIATPYCLQPIVEITYCDYSDYYSVNVHFEAKEEPHVEVLGPDSEKNLLINFLSYKFDKLAGKPMDMLIVNTSYYYDSNLVFFEKNKIKIYQKMSISYEMQKVPGQIRRGSGEIEVTDTYTLSVTQSGEIKPIKLVGDEEKDTNYTTNEISVPRTHNYLDNTIKLEIEELSNTNLLQVPTNQIRNFVFPGGNVFTYKDVQFSEHQDLVTAIRYVSPS